MKKQMVLILLGLVLAGCATPHANVAPQTRLAFNADVGRMNYEDALSRFGRPDWFRKNKKTFVAEWKSDYEAPDAMGQLRADLVSSPLLYGPQPTATKTCSSTLSLVFDSKTSLLTDWSLKT